MKASFQQLVGSTRRPNLFRSGDQVMWRVGTRRYSGRVKHFTPCARACNVRSRDGFVWLLPVQELARVA